MLHPDSEAFGGSSISTSFLAWASLVPISDEFHRGAGACPLSMVSAQEISRLLHQLIVTGMGFEPMASRI